MYIYYGINTCACICICVYLVRTIHRWLVLFCQQFYISTCEAKERKCNLSINTIVGNLAILAIQAIHQAGRQ